MVSVFTASCLKKHIKIFLILGKLIVNFYLVKSSTLSRNLNMRTQMYRSGKGMEGTWSEIIHHV